MTNASPAAAAAPAPVEVLLDTPAAAHRCTLSEKTLVTWRSRRMGPPYIKLHGAVRYRAEDLDAWIAENTVTPS